MRHEIRLCGHELTVPDDGIRDTKELVWGKVWGKAVWRCIRDIQIGRRELVPVRSVTVRDEEGNGYNTPSSNSREGDIFPSFCIQREFDEEMQKARQRPLRPNMSALPLEEKLWGRMES